MKNFTHFNQTKQNKYKFKMIVIFYETNNKKTRENQTVIQIKHLISFYLKKKKLIISLHGLLLELGNNSF